MDFNDYFKQAVQDTIKNQVSYMGIVKKEYPKWIGWNIIRSLNKKGEPYVDDAILESCVQNFYYIKYLEQKFDL